MFIYQNTIYYSNNLNPDGTKFEYPKGTQVLTAEEEQYIESVTMEDIVNDNVQARYTVIIDKLYPGKRGSNKNKK
jgi:hypothetical protein